MQKCIFKVFNSQHINLVPIHNRHAPLAKSPCLQNKENKHTPSTVYINSRLAVTSPAFQTPGPLNLGPHAEASGEAITKPVPSCPEPLAHSSPSGVTALTHITTSLPACGHNTPTSAAAVRGAVLQVGAFGGNKARTRLGDPAHSTPLLTHVSDRVPTQLLPEDAAAKVCLCAASSLSGD